MKTRILSLFIVMILSACAKPAPDLSPIPTVFLPTATQGNTPTPGGMLLTVTPFSPTAAVILPTVSATTTIPPSVSTPQGTPPPTSSNGDTVYQAYEHGFMLMVFDLDSVKSRNASTVNSTFLAADCIYPYQRDQGMPVFPAELHLDPQQGYRYCVSLIELGLPGMGASPADFSSAFRHLWSFSDMQTALGNPVGEPVIYYASVPANPKVNQAPEGPWNLPVVSLPTGETLYCGSRGATSSTCYLGAAESATPQPVIAFTVTPTEGVHQGSTVTAEWNVEGGGVRLCVSNPEYYGGQCSDVAAAGSHQVSIPWDEGTVYIMLRVTPYGQVAQQIDQSITIDLGCKNQWAVSNVPSTYRCPGPAQTFIGASAQPFEHGWMIYTGSGYIILLDAPMPNYPGGHQVGYVLDPLNLAGDTSAQIGTPPSGLYAPTSGFGILWRGDVSYSAGGYRQWLGWATQPEFNFDATEQCWVLKGYLSATGWIGHCYLTHPQGGVIDLVQDNMWSYWILLGES